MSWKDFFLNRTGKYQLRKAFVQSNGPKFSPSKRVGLYADHMNHGLVRLQSVFLLDRLDRLDLETKEVELIRSNVNNVTKT